MQGSIDLKGIREAMSNPESPSYFLKDSEIMEAFGLSRSYLRLLRKTHGIQKHRARVLEAVKALPYTGMYVQDLVDALGDRVSYMCLYKIIEEEGLAVLKRGKND